VYKGFILSRQRILAVTTTGQGAATRCEIVLDPNVVLVAPTQRRAFQGWRYLPLEDAPPDLGRDLAHDAPPELARKLREIGAW